MGVGRMLVSQILSVKADQGVITVAPDASVAEAVAILSRHKIGALIVSKNGRQAEGILSERDIVREIGVEGEVALSRRVSEVMTSKLVTCQRGDEAVTLLEKMTKGRFRHMPVVEEGQLLGLVSIGDVVKARLDELNLEREALEGMIKGY